jgi:hypothetical protein
MQTQLEEKNLNGRDNLGELVVGGRNVNMGFREIGKEYLNQDSDQWRAPVNTVMNIQLAERLSASQSLSSLWV